MADDDTLHPAVALERGCSDQRGFVTEPNDPFGYMAQEPDAWYRAREEHRNAYRAKHPRHPLPPELMRTTEETHRYLYDDARGFVQEPLPCQPRKQPRRGALRKTKARTTPQEKQKPALGKAHLKGSPANC